MKLVPSLVFILLIFCFCVDSKDDDPFNDIERKINESLRKNPLLIAIASIFGMNETNKKQEKKPASIDHNKTHLTDLNFDCIIHIFEHLDFGDLVNVAKINPDFEMAAAYSFKIKYSKYDIVIDDTLSLPYTDIPIVMLFGLNNEEKKRTHSVNGSEIQIFDYQMIIDTFNYFDVKNLRLIYSNYEHKNAKLLGELISNYSTDTLRFDSCRRDTLEFIRKPLTNVKKVIFGNRFLDYGNNEVLYRTIKTISHVRKGFGQKYWDFGNSVLSIDELFPSIEELHVHWWAPLDYFYSHMPNLKHLYIKGYTIFNQSDAFYEEILRKNPQIQSIEVQRSHSSKLEMINSLLPNLQSLILNEYSSESRVCFENVKTFIVNFSHRGIDINNLDFPNLRKVEMDSIRGDPALWVNFLQAHSQITEFHFIYSNSNDDDLKQILNCLPNLEKLYIDIRSGVINSNRIHNLLRDHSKLCLFHLTFERAWDKKQFPLNYESIGPSWNINDENDKEFLFDR